VPEEWHRIRASGLPERHLKTLRDLTERQRHVLVFTLTDQATGLTLVARHEVDPR